MRVDLPRLLTNLSDALKLLEEWNGGVMPELLCHVRLQYTQVGVIRDSNIIQGSHSYQHELGLWSSTSECGPCLNAKTEEFHLLKYSAAIL